MIDIKTDRICGSRRVAQGMATLAFAALVFLGTGMGAAARHDRDDWDRNHPPPPLLGGPGPFLPIAGGPPPFHHGDWDDDTPWDWD